MKKKSKGVVILCVYLMLSCVAGINMMIVAQYSRNLHLNMSVEEKRKMIQTETYQKANITSIEKFNEGWVNETGVVLNPYTFLLIILMLIFAIGIWFLLNWVRISLILFELFNAGLLILGTILGWRFWKNETVLILHGFLVVPIVIIYFLTRPKVKEQFIKIK